MYTQHTEFTQNTQNLHKTYTQHTERTQNTILAQIIYGNMYTETHETQQKQTQN